MKNIKWGDGFDVISETKQVAKNTMNKYCFKPTPQTPLSIYAIFYYNHILLLNA